MSERVKVLSVSGGKPWQDLTYYDMVFDRNGEDFACSWGKKSEGAPHVGEELEGEFYEKKPGEWRFRKASKSPSPGPSSGGKRDWQPESQRDPERAARILRQHSQGMAVQLYAAMKPSTAQPGQLRVFLVEWADWFDADVGQAATQAQGASASQESTFPPSSPPESGLPPAVEKQPADESHWWFEDHLMKAGLDGVGANRLATFILDRFSPEQGKRAEQGLSDFDTQAKTLADLESAFRKTEGEPVPKDDLVEGLPF